MVIGAVLTGGQSRRFGSDKALALAGEATMGSIAVAGLRGAGCDPVVAVGGAEGHQLGVPVVSDRTPHLGPLGGISSVLVWAKTGHILIIPCDLPLLETTDLEPLVTWADNAEPDRGAVGVIEGKAHPIVAIWPASASIAVARLLRTGSGRLSDALSIVDFASVELTSRVAQDADTPDELEELLGHRDSSQ